MGGLFVCEVSSVLIAWLFAWWVGGFLGGWGGFFGVFFLFLFFVLFLVGTQTKVLGLYDICFIYIGKLSHVTFVGPDKV